jgi:hypothetical protein
MRPFLFVLALTLSSPLGAQAPKPNPFDIPLATLPQPKGPSASGETAHLRLNAAVNETAAAPGKRLSIFFDITPQRGMHVYAPGKHGYQVISVVFDPQPWLKATTLHYAPSEIYYFKPLDERIPVYSQPFRLVQEVTILATPEAQKILSRDKTLTISGKVNYQACDDRACYPPQSVPVRWTLPLSPPARD